jgi:hypothetical protein
MVSSKKTGMTSHLGGAEVFDAYTRRARLQPALLAILPIGIAVLVWFPNSLTEWGVFASLLTSAGGMALLARIARIRGKRIEPSIFEKWGGKPTTVALRHRDTRNPVLLARRQAQLQQIAKDIRLPTAEEERADPATADATYDACVAVLIERTRDRKRFRLLFDENCHYGFWRNLLGLRPFGILSSSLATAAIAVLIYRHNFALEFKPLVALGIDLLFLIGWFFLVKDTAVQMAAESYRDRLLAACEDLTS